MRLNPQPNLAPAIEPRRDVGIRSTRALMRAAEASQVVKHELKIMLTRHASAPTRISKPPRLDDRSNFLLELVKLLLLLHPPHLLLLPGQRWPAPLL